MKRIGFIFILLTLLLSFPASAQEDLPWWNDRVFYEIFVRSFYDSDGDGIGDIQGLISQLDYLNDGDPTTDSDLGITGIWLMPVNEGPTYHGYHITDYLGIESDYGTMDDFREFIDEAHQRGIAVIMDLVINHASNEHPWFKSAQTMGSKYEDWFVWADENPRFVGPDGQTVWHELNGRYYYGVFNGEIPDLNFRNPEVTEEIYSIIDFWLTDVGVDGFRLDAIRHLIEDGSTQENTPETHAWLQAYLDYTKSLNPDALSVGEIWTRSAEIAPYVPDEVDIAFEFDLATSMLASANIGSQISVKNMQQRVLDLYPYGQYAAFLTNHDQNRVRSVVTSDEVARTAASMLLTNPGVPFMYYGEEIGMTGTKPDPQIRTPMQWSEVEGAGFTLGAPWQRINGDYTERNVMAQAADPDSLWNHYRNLIHTRNNNPALHGGDFSFVQTNSTHIYGFIRSTETQTVLVLINLDDEAVTDYGLRLDVDASEAVVLYADRIDGDIAAPTAEGYKPLDSFPPQSTLIVELK